MRSTGTFANGPQILCVAFRPRTQNIALMARMPPDPLNPFTRRAVALLASKVDLYFESRYISELKGSMAASRSLCKDFRGNRMILFDACTFPRRWHSTSPITPDCYKANRIVLLTQSPVTRASNLAACPHSKFALPVRKH